MVFVAAARDRTSVPATIATVGSEVAGIGTARSVPAGTTPGRSARALCAAARPPALPPSAVTDADLEQLGDEIAELAAHLHAATYRLLVRLREFDARAGWCGGFRSCAHWLSWRTGIGLGAAREQVRVARALEQLPLLGEAMRRGELSFAKIRAATRVATSDNEERLLDLARHGTAAHVEKVVRAWRRVDRLAEQTEERERHRSRALTLYFDDDGMAILRGRLDPEVGAVLERALAAAGEALYGRSGATNAGEAAGAASSEPATVEQRRADAIGLIAECALRSGMSAATTADTPAAPSQSDGPAAESRADRFQVVVHVDAATLREAADTGQAVLADTRISAERRGGWRVMRAA